MRNLHKFIAALLLAIPLGVAAQTAYVNTDVNVRAGPDSTYPLVGWLQAGTSVSVGGCVAGYAWCDVYVGNLRGFVYSTYLSYPYQSNQVPIYTYGPALGLPLITFSLGNYWDNYYRTQPFYGRRSYWAARPYYPPPPRFGNNWRPPVYHGNNNYRPPQHSGGNYRPPQHSGGNYRPPQQGNRPPPQGNRPPQQGNRPPEQHAPQGNRGQSQRSFTNGNKNKADGGEAGG